MAHDLVGKLALVKEGKMLSVDYAIELARRPEFAERARQLKMTNELLVNILVDVVWGVAMDLPTVLASRFDQSVAQYYATTPEDTKGSRQRCPKCKKLFRSQGLHIHMRKMHGARSLKQAVKVKAKAEPKQSTPTANKMPPNLITDCTTCKEVGFKGVRYADHYEQVGGQATREYWYGIVHEAASKKTATFHRLGKLDEESAKKRAEKYHQFNAKGEVTIPSSQQKQSTFFENNEQ